MKSSAMMVAGRGNEGKVLVWGILVLLMLSSLSSLPVQASREWYNALNKPGFTPDSLVFSIVWPVLYILSGYAAWTVWRQREAQREGVEEALLFFCFQMAINLLWTSFFFGAQSPWLGLLWIFLVWFLVALTTWVFFGISRIAGVAMLPYLLWVSFAVYLNFTIWQLNLS